MSRRERRDFAGFPPAKRREIYKMKAAFPLKTLVMSHGRGGAIIVGVVVAYDYTHVNIMVRSFSNTFHRFRPGRARRLKDAIQGPLQAWAAKRDRDGLFKVAGGKKEDRTNPKLLVRGHQVEISDQDILLAGLLSIGERWDA